MTSSLDRLLSQLNQTQLSQKDNPLYQVIKQLIQRIRDLETALNTNISNLSDDLSESSFITVNNEITNLPNSRQLIAGDNINLDESIIGELTINAIVIDSENITNSTIIELFKYAFKRLDMIEEILGIDRTTRDILVPEQDLQLIQDIQNGNIGIKSMR